MYMQQLSVCKSVSYEFSVVQNDQPLASCHPPLTVSDQVTVLGQYSLHYVKD